MAPISYADQYLSACTAMFRRAGVSWKVHSSALRDSYKAALFLAVIFSNLFAMFFKLLGAAGHIPKVGGHEEIGVPYCKKQDKSWLRQG